MVDVALGGHRGGGPLGDDPDDDHDAFASVLAQPYLITGPDRMRGLDPQPVDPDVPGAAGTGRRRAGLDEPHRPDPAVHPSRLIIGHPATVMRSRPERRGRGPVLFQVRHQVHGAFLGEEQPGVIDRDHAGDTGDGVP